MGGNLEERVKRQDLVLNFTNSYSRDWIEEHSQAESESGFCCIDCSKMSGTDMYCTPEAEEILMGILQKYPLKGIHFTDSGNYHYMTRLFTKQITEPYQLVFFDNHTDMQPSMIPDLLSCGAWAKQSVEEDPFLKKLVVVGPPQSSFHEVDVKNAEKLVCISWEMLVEGLTKDEIPEALLEAFDPKLPLYVSVDKDVLSEAYARTNWDQGAMSLPQLFKLLMRICEGKMILGVDICGELPDAQAYEAAEVQWINNRTNEELYQFFDKLL